MSMEVTAKLHINELAEQLACGETGSLTLLIQALDACKCVVQKRYAKSSSWRERHEIAVQRTVFLDPNCIIDEQTIHLLECIIAEARKP